MRSRIHFEAAVLALAVGSRCGGQGQDVEVRLFFQLEERLAQLQLDVYRDPPDSLCDIAPMQNPGPWPTVTADPYMTQAVVYGSNDLELNPDRYGFVFRGGDSAEGFLIGTKDLARGCTIAELGSGVNPPVVIEIHEIFWPGLCGDGHLDPEETCDDGNTDPPSATDHCAADCLSTPVVQLNDIDAGISGDVAQFEPDVAFRDGGYYLTYTSDSRGDDDPYLETSTNIFAKKLDRHAAGVLIGPSYSFRLNATENLAQIQAIIAAAGNIMNAVWIESHPINGMYIRFRSMDMVSGAGGVDATINGTGGTSKTHGVIAGNGTSTTQIAAWVHGGDVMCRRVVDRAPETAAEAACAVTAGGNQDQPAAAMAPDGTYAVAWRAPGGIYVRFFDADGTALTEDLQVSTIGDRPSIAFDSSGRLMAAWREGETVMGRIYDATGAPDGEAFAVGWGATTADNRGVVDVTAGLGRDGPVFLVVWIAPIAGVRGRLVTGTGTFGVNRFVSADPGNVPFEDTGEFSVTPSAYEGIQTARAAATPDGEALVVWDDRSTGDRDIQGRIVPTS